VRLIFFVKINKPEMIKFRNLERHEFRSSIDIIIIRIGNKINKRSQSRRMSSPIFFRNEIDKICNIAKRFWRIRSFAKNGFEMNRFSLN
jgi:hypothetical protein